MASADLTAARLRELLHYDPDTGVFTWRAPRQRIAVGAVAGTDDGAGYTRICIDRKLYRAHRLACLYMTGEWPASDVDHLNTNRSDARQTNLRQASPAINSQNQRRAHKGNSSGMLGVSWAAKKRRWRAQIRVQGRTRHIGYFDTPELAHAAYVAEKRKAHPGCTI